MAKSKGKFSTFSILIIFLLSVAVFVFASLYLETRHKNELLVLEVQRLESSQVLLMVPDEQAEVVAKWMSENPEATKALLEQAKPKQEVKVSVGPGVVDSVVNTPAFDKNSKTAALEMSDEHVDEAQFVSENLPQEKRTENTIDDMSEVLPKPKEAVVPFQETIKNKISTDKGDESRLVAPRTISEDEQGVKVIVLPHGGIRVTTREND
ncbi:hypothetical protein [Shewanella nanhaiensis]|uniref:Membrane anchored protein in chemotaxis locus n=1 Tax=Shewanella nanhaiensis TaxID=2864872 RepID=A0ABS7E666_9GAMM|nr:hypothetical protein [Shewanella nanhaiensis]MBW8185183.1 hypothetical protein [Shewanella nanhaiensis]